MAVSKNKTVDDLSYLAEIGYGVDGTSSSASDIYPFGISSLDVQLGGGLYSGKIYEFYGRPSHGKSTLALEASKAFTKYCSNPINNISKYAVLWIETESAFDIVRASYMGCDVKRFMVREADTIESGFDIIQKTLENCIKKGVRLFVVWDTIAAAKTEADKKDGMYGGGMGFVARLLSHLVKQVTIPLAQSDSTMIFVNQVYDGFGQNEGMIAKGGQAIKFYSSVRLELKSVGDIVTFSLAGTPIVKGIISQVYTKKNKLALPRQRTDVYLYGETGLEPIQTIFMFLKSVKKLVTGGAGWTTIAFGEKTYKVQSWEKLKGIIEATDPEVGEWLDYQIFDYYKDTSPLTKVRIINDLWKYEEKFLGKRVTVLTEKELEVAKLLYKDLQVEDNTQVIPSIAGVDVANFQDNLNSVDDTIIPVIQ